MESDSRVKSIVNPNSIGVFGSRRIVMNEGLSKSCMSFVKRICPGLRLTTAGAPDAAASFFSSSTRYCAAWSFFFRNISNFFKL